jgi:spermidine dehydrogenase
LRSFEAAHRLRDGSPFDISQAAVSEHHDLIVVGAGISGLAAAHFYRQRRPGARMLILDTNDDFGGHAKRNEFDVDGRTLLGYGGTQSIDGPAHKWDGVAKGLLKDLGIDVKRFDAAFDRNFYSRWNLRQSVFFKKEVFGVDRLVRRPFGTWKDWDEDPRDSDSLRAYVEQFPLEPHARQQLFDMFWSDRDVLAGMTAKQRLDVLEHTSYRDFLKQYWHADEAVLKVLQTRTHELWAVGIDAVPASETLSLPGLKAQRAALGEKPEEPYIYHFPDGNASIARMLVRKLIPSIAPGTTMEDIVLARFDYAQIDRPEHPVRIRLNSTAVDVLSVRSATNSAVCWAARGSTSTATWRRSPSIDGRMATPTPRLRCTTTRCAKPPSPSWHAGPSGE